jgi:hypothetical protein
MNLGFDINDWESATPIEMGEYESLKLGGHEVIIMDARLYTSEQTKNTSLKVSVDISGNDEQKGFFKKQYDENQNADKRWPSGAVKYLSLKTESLGYTKGFITALEKSNNGFKFDTSKGWEQLKGLKCAGVFGLEEYERQDGGVGTTTKLTQFRSLDKLGEIKIPRVKLLDGSYVDYEEYKSGKVTTSTSNAEVDAIEISMDKLPF